MRLRAQSYRNLEGIPRAVILTPWYWRLVAVAAPVMILGGFLMLSTTYDHDTTLRVSGVAVGIFAVAILLAGVCATVLACVVVHDLTFQLNEVFRPSLISCVLGFFTVFYNLIISPRYVWNVPAIATTAAAGTGAVAYTLLYIWTQRKINVRNVLPPHIPVQQDDPPSEASQSGTWQSPEYYQNYIKNMFPTATVSHAPSGMATPASREPQSSITEEEMQRQQMLMLLLRQDQAPHVSSSTFKIEWQPSEQDYETPIHPRMNPRSDTISTNASLSMSVPGGLEPWDGVWRGVRPTRTITQMSRERRRQQIEQGL